MRRDIRTTQNEGGDFEQKNASSFLLFFCVVVVGRWGGCCKNNFSSQKPFHAWGFFVVGKGRRRKVLFMHMSPFFFLFFLSFSSFTCSSRANE